MKRQSRGFEQRTWRRDISPRPQQPLMPNASGKAAIIRFSYSATNGIASAICEIKSRMVGAIIPDTILDGSAVIVHDPSGCHFNGPPEDLTGRQGWAAYMDSGTTAMPDQVYAAPHWEVFEICCDDSECYE